MKTILSLSYKIQQTFNLIGYSERTKDIYFKFLIACKKYFKKSLISLSKEELEQYFSEKVVLKEAQSTIRLRYFALKFLFTKIYNKPFPLRLVPTGKTQKKLPVVFDLSEIKAILDVTTNTKHKAILSVTYSGGLRVSETRSLKVRDIDSKRMTIKICQGKGKKDRYTILSQNSLKTLRIYYSQYHPCEYLFPGYSKDKPLAIRTLQLILKHALRKANIHKDASFHTLRHSFATHLYESGIGLPHIQKLLGHTSIKTTMIYIHLAKPKILDISSPLDSID